MGTANFLGFSIDRSKKYVKSIKNDIKIDAVDPWAAADNPPPPPGHNGQVYGPLQRSISPLQKQGQGVVAEFTSLEVPSRAPQ